VIDDRPAARDLLAKVRDGLPGLERLLVECSAHWGYQDPVYRFYHHSFKVYGLQTRTLQIVDTLRSLAPDRTLNEWFEHIVADGTGKTWEPSHNSRWLEVTRPILEAFFHARFFLEMAVHYGRELHAPPQSLPSGWAAFLYLYDLR
jgi:hypothetical protein